MLALPRFKRFVVPVIILGIALSACAEERSDQSGPDSAEALSGGLQDPEGDADLAPSEDLSEGDSSDSNVGSQARASDAAIGPEEDPWAALRGAIEDADIDDLSVLFGTAEGVAFSHSKGDSSPEKVYALASASKLLTAILSLKLVEAGVWSLEDQPQDYLSFWSTDPMDPLSQITLEQLLSFTSGFSGGTGLSPLDPGIPCVEEADTTLSACAQEIAEEWMSYTPGSTFYYGPAHMQVAAAMAVALTGKRLNALFREHLTDPLGLTSVFFIHPSLDNPRAGGAGTASAVDYAAILTALAKGELLSPASLALLTQDHTAEPVVMATGGGVNGLGQGWHYALGCWRECQASAYDESCEGDGVISSPGAFGFYPFFNTATGVWGLIATQRDLGSGGASVTVPFGQAWSLLAHEILAPALTRP